MNTTLDSTDLAYVEHPAVATHLTEAGQEEALGDVLAHHGGHLTDDLHTYADKKIKSVSILFTPHGSLATSQKDYLCPTDSLEILLPCTICRRTNNLNAGCSLPLYITAIVYSKPDNTKGSTS